MLHSQPWSIRIRTNQLQIRIHEAQKHTDPTAPAPDPDPEHWINLFRTSPNSCFSSLSLSFLSMPGSMLLCY
jgi:hypothetical protein